MGELNCPACQDLLMEPVTLPCGVSYCKECINKAWDQAVKDDFSCPQCNDKFKKKPGLRKNIDLDKKVNLLRKAGRKVDQVEQAKENEKEQIQEKTNQSVKVSKEEAIKSQPKPQEKQKVQEVKPKIMPNVTARDGKTAATVPIILPSNSKRREEFLQYFCDLTLDPNTVNYSLILSENNKAVTSGNIKQSYPDHPERFDYYYQVLCKESVCGRCYWEVEWSGIGVAISVSYKDISRKGLGNECKFGRNDKSWSLRCYSSFFFCHNNNESVLRVTSSSRIGVYVDHKAGTLSFYSVSDNMKRLHSVRTTFTQPLYVGFRIYSNTALKSESTMRLCGPKE